MLIIQLNVSAVLQVWQVAGGHQSHGTSCSKGQGGGNGPKFYRGSLHIRKNFLMERVITY